MYLYGLMYYDMRESKYLGGSKVATFRLPLCEFKSTRARVQALLDEIAIEITENAPKSAIPMIARAETTLPTAKTKQVKNGVVYPCGCKLSGELFIRSSGCKMIRVIHGIE